MTNNNKEILKYVNDLGITLPDNNVETQKIATSTKYLIEFYIEGLNKRGYTKDVIREKSNYLIEHIKKKLSNK